MKTGKRFRVHKHKCLLKSDPDRFALLTQAGLWVTPFTLFYANGICTFHQWKIFNLNSGDLCHCRVLNS
jgi:hypothetical protein